MNYDLVGELRRQTSASQWQFLASVLYFARYRARHRNRRQIFYFISNAVCPNTRRRRRCDVVIGAHDIMALRIFGPDPTTWPFGRHPGPPGALGRQLYTTHDRHGRRRRRSKPRKIRAFLYMRARIVLRRKAHDPKRFCGGHYGNPLAVWRWKKKKC